MNKDLDRLQHICESCELLLCVTDCDYTNYQADRDKQAAVERYFEILGEAAKMVSADMQQRRIRRSHGVWPEICGISLSIPM
jgi:uncharacterized protein with HEPN domain